MPKYYIQTASSDTARDETYYRRAPVHNHNAAIQFSRDIKARYSHDFGVNQLNIRLGHFFSNQPKGAIPVGAVEI